MAQVTGGTSFDLAAKHKHIAAERVLSRAADVWARQGGTVLKVDSVIAVLLQMYLTSWGALTDNPRNETLTLDQWLPQVTTPHEEFHRLLPAADAAVVATCISLLQKELSFAAEQWALGDPEQPPTTHALNAVEHVLFSHKFITRPPNPKLPTTVCK